jgi:hypothetical protein
MMLIGPKVSSGFNEKFELTIRRIPKKFKQMKRTDVSLAYELQPIKFGGFIFFRGSTVVFLCCYLKDGTDPYNFQIHDPLLLI